MIFPSLFSSALYVEPSHYCSVISSAVRQKYLSCPKRSSYIFGMYKMSRHPTNVFRNYYVKLGIFQGQGMHRKRHAVIMSLTLFYKNKTLSKDYLEAGVHLYVLMSYTFTKKHQFCYMYLSSQLKVQRYYCGSHTTTRMDTQVQAYFFRLFHIRCNIHPFKSAICF